MIKHLSALILSICLVAATATAEPMTIKSDDSMVKVLTAYKGKKVSVKLGNGEELAGTVKEVTGQLLQLSELTGKEFYDAVISIDRVSAVVVRAKD